MGSYILTTHFFTIYFQFYSSLCFLYEPPMQTGGADSYNFNVPENYEILTFTPYCNDGGFYVCPISIEGNQISVKLLSSGGSSSSVGVGLKVLVKNK